MLHEANRRLGGRAGSTGTAVHRQPRSARPVRRRHHLALPARAPHSGTDGTAAGGRRPVPLPGEAPAYAAVGGAAGVRGLRRGTPVCSDFPAWTAVSAPGQAAGGVIRTPRCCAAWRRCSPTTTTRANCRPPSSRNGSPACSRCRQRCGTCAAAGRPWWPRSSGMAAHSGTHRDGQPGRRGWGVFSLAAAVVTVLLVAVMCWLFNPRSPAAPTHLGGLAERAVSVATLAWWVILGWRLFRAGLPASAERGYHPGPGAAVRPT